MNRYASNFASNTSNSAGERAVIDIGSNTVRLVIYGEPRRAPTVLLNEKVVARLGQDLEETGMIPDQSIEMALSALRRYTLIMEDRGIRDLEVVATAAARDAKNGPKFIKQIEQIGLSPRLLSGKQEARAAAAGVAGAFPGAEGLVADLGGGSLELISLRDGSSREGKTLPLGTLRLGTLRAQGSEKFDARVSDLLEQQDWAKQSGGDMFVVGGTWRCLAAYVIRQDEYPLTDPHGFVLSAKRAAEVAATVSEMASDELATIGGISANRAATLPDAAAMMRIMLKTFAPKRVVFSSWGLREGLLFDKLEPLSRDQDPLLAGVSHFVGERGVEPAVATHVAGWCAGVRPPGDPSDERWQLAATMLALAAARVEPNWRAQHAKDWALYKRWIALDAQERGEIAAALLASCGQTSLPQEVRQIAPKSNVKRAVTWGLAIRLCRRMTAGTRLSLLTSSLRLRDDHLVLTLDPSRVGLLGHGVEKDLRNLANWMEVTSEIALGSID